MSAVPNHAPSVVHMLAEAAARAPEREALVCGAERLTYRAYACAVADFAVELRELGVAGQRVALVMGSGVDHAIAAFAIQAAGAQVAPLNPAYTARELGEILADAEPSAIVHDDSLGDVLAPLVPNVPAARRMALGPARRLTDPKSRDVPLPLPDPATRALLQYTGGTSGRSKGVELSHAAIAANVAQREAALPTSRADRALVMTPLFHSYATAMGLHLAARAAATLVILPRFKPELALAAVAGERVTLFCGAPTIFNAILAFPGAAGADWSSLRLSYSGSAALSSATLARWESLTGCGICEGYGQTEAGPVLTYNPERGLRKPGTVGPPVPGTVIDIVDVATGRARLPTGEAGEIRARGPQIMLGYRNRTEETAQALRDGWLYTGDIGRLDADGYLTITDRKKELVIVSGYNVYPREIEEALSAHPAVAEAGVVGRPDAYRGEALVAFFAVRPGAELTAQTAASHLADRLVRYKIPQDFRILPSLPKTAVGKIDKTALRDLARACEAPKPEG